MTHPSPSPVTDERDDFSRITLEHNIEVILRENRDAHPHTMLRKLMSAIPVCARPKPVTDDGLLPCPFCGQEAEAYAIRYAICRGLRGDQHVHSVILMTKCEWNTRLAASDRDVLVDKVEQEISAWAFAHDIDGAIRNELFARIRAALIPLAGELP